MSDGESEGDLQEPAPPRRVRKQSGTSPKTVFLLLIALACGLAAAVLSAKLVDGNPSKGGMGKLSGLLSPAVVAKQDIAAGTVVQNPAELFRIAYYRAGDEPRQALKSLDELKDKVVVRALAEDQPVKAVDVSAK
ncbi:MAG: SAF domain-containing protein [Planctomycetia bacterium]|nr:SAF domain-containing protein [Planctomycetia bacterium]